MRSLHQALFSFLLVAFLASGIQAQQPVAAPPGKGAIIIVSIEGNVRIRDTSTRIFIPQENVAAGRYIYDGYTAITGANSKVVFLLTNGSLTTLEEKSEMDFKEFTQVKFPKQPGSVADLQAEPSQSTTKLRLGYGDMVFNVKKLNPGSVFEIDSPIGFAGIRGTDGKVSVRLDPQTGNFTGSVNMLSGTVQFIDPSRNQIPLPAGEAVHVNATPAGIQVGDTRHVQVQPEVTQEMQIVTQEAEAQTEEIQVADVSTLVEEVEKLLEDTIQPREEETQEEPEPQPSESTDPTEPKEDEPKEETNDTTEPTEPEPEPEPDPTEPAESTESAATTTSEENQPTTEAGTEPEPEPVVAVTQVDTAIFVDQNNEIDETISFINDTGEKVDSGSSILEKIQDAGLSSGMLVQLKSYSEDMTDRILAESGEQVRYLLSMAASENQLEHFYSLNDSFREQLTSSILPSQTKTLLSHNLGQTDLEAILAYAATVRDNLISEPLTRIQAILDFQLGDNEALALFQFSPNLRDALVTSDNADLVKSLLDLAKSESETANLLAGFTDAEDLVAQTDTFGKSPTQPDPDLDSIINDAVSQLLADTQTNGNEYIFNLLLDEGNGTIDGTLLTKGQLANNLLTDTQISGSLPATQLFSVEEALSSPFYHKVAGLVGTLEDSPTTGSALAAKQLSLDPGTLELPGENAFYITAAEGIHFNGNVALQSSGSSLHDLYFASGEDFSFAPGSQVSFREGSLHLASRTSSDFVQVSMEAGGDLGITSLENLLFQDATLRVPAGDRVHLEAYNHLSVNGLQFSSQIQQIYMQAITIDLRNVFFPDGSMVYLQSQFGGIDGIYPNFGSSEVGRVNFIENVGYHQTVIQNRATFDQFRDQIQIRPIGTN